MNASEYIVQRLTQLGVDVVFGYQGGNITNVIDAIGKNENIKYIQSYNEQGAAFAANAYAQARESVGVAVSSSGPGAINLINGIANAYYDSIPCLFITGNVNSKTIKTSSLVRQSAFQESDIVSMVSGITIYANRILDASMLRYEMDKAVKMMLCGRPGPVLLDIPHDVQKQPVLSDCQKTFHIAQDTITANVKDNIKDMLRMLKQAKNPLLLVGGGCRNVSVRKKLRKVAERLKIPVVSSLCGKDAFPNDNKLYQGMIGTYGNHHANECLRACDLLLALGSRMDERQMYDSNGWIMNRPDIIHVDIDESELNRVVESKYSICCDAGVFLEKLLEGMGDGLCRESGGMCRTGMPKEDKVLAGDVEKAICGIIDITQDIGAVTVDVGLHQMAVAKSAIIKKDVHFLNSAGLGCMGYAIPAAIGASYALPKKNIVAFVGDGGLQMNLQELQALAREGLPILVVVMNNHKLQMISDYHSKAFGGRYYGSKWGYSVPDIHKISEAFGISYEKWSGKYTHTVLPKILEVEYE